MRGEARRRLPPANRPARAGCTIPVGARWDVRGSGGLWVRQDGDFAVAVQVLKLGRDHLCGVRRARERDG